MNEIEFKKLAKAHLLILSIWFIVGFVIALLASNVEQWATEGKSGWQSDVVGFVFMSICAVGGLIALLSGILIYGWIKEYKWALAESKEKTSKELFETRKSVLGPIPWR